MSFDEFIKKYNGKSVDFDGKYNAQCVDLFRQYLKEVLKLKQPKPVRGAAWLYLNYETDPLLNKQFNRVKNTITGVPKKGDIVIWDTRAGGGYGHVGMFVSGNVISFTSFDQNWKRPYITDMCWHNYKYVLGWLTPKK